jgi:acyl-CoA thioesterase FadM
MKESQIKTTLTNITSVETTEIYARPNDFDRAGHINNSVILEYMESGRLDWLDRHGLHRGKNIFPVVTRINIGYHTEILSRKVIVKTWLEELETSKTYRVKLHQTTETTVGNTNRNATTAVVEIAFIDKNKRRPCTLSDFLEESLEYQLNH